jgi:hypothetical protein
MASSLDFKSPATSHRDASAFTRSATGGGATMKTREYRVFYRTNATSHYLDLGRHAVELARTEAHIELNGQLTRCIVEDVERVASDRSALAGCNLYLRRK